MKIEITMKEEEGHDYWYTVSVDNTYADKMTFDEMLGLIVRLTIPKEKKCLQRLKTYDERKRLNDLLYKQKSPENQTFLTRLWSKS